MHEYYHYKRIPKYRNKKRNYSKSRIFEKAIKPAYKIWVDFGEEMGVLKTSAQITQNYTPEALIGKNILGCTNLEERQIADFKSQFLLLGFTDINGNIVLASLDNISITTPNGNKLH